MKYTLRRLVLAMLVVGLAYGVVRLLDSAASSRGIRLLGGGEVTGLADVTDSPIIIVVYWSADCPYCERLLKGLQTYYNGMRGASGRAIDVVAINIGDGEGTVRRAVEEWGITFPVVVGVRTGPAQGVPFTQVLVQGDVIAEKMGYFDPAPLIDQLLRGLAGEGAE
jgi:peroxiredoxin